MLDKEDPLTVGTFFYILSYVAITNLNASDAKQTSRLIDGFPGAIKAYFVRDTPHTVYAFAERLKSVAVKHAYKQTAAFPSTAAASLAALTNARSCCSVIARSPKITSSIGC